ncbi:MAG: DUF3868 domain-containing protein [Tannerellaceae bacterium]|jgi:hypothetical protein|nr:DUF3868 domain-containing protein [Tannerellaceae bacterium]
MRIPLSYIIILCGLAVFPSAPKAQDVEQLKVYAGAVYVKQHVAEVRNDSLFLDMDITIYGLPINSANSLVLTPVLFSEKDSLKLPHIRINGKHRDRMYGRAVAFSKGEKRDKSAYIVLRHEYRMPQIVSYRDTVAYAPWMEEAGLLLEGSCRKHNDEQISAYMDILTDHLNLSR